jgi:hypothetical protein
VSLRHCLQRMNRDSGYDARAIEKGGGGGAVFTGIKSASAQ